MLTKVIGLEVNLGSATTFPPAISFPNNKDTPLMGKVGLVLTATEPVTKSDTKLALFKGVLTHHPSIP